MLRYFLPGLTILVPLAAVASADNWYQSSFWLLHEDHHTQRLFEVGRDADLDQTARVVISGAPLRLEGL